MLVHRVWPPRLLRGHDVSDMPGFAVQDQQNIFIKLCWIFSYISTDFLGLHFSVDLEYICGFRQIREQPYVPLTTPMVQYADNKTIGDVIKLCILI